MAPTPKNQFASSFREIQFGCSRFWSRIITQKKLTLPQYTLLSCLAHKRRISMTEASAQLHISKPAITNLADRLEQNGYLRRLPHPSDRRVSLIEIQPKGQKLIQDTQSSFLSLLLETFGRFGERDQATIAHFYEQLSRTIEKALAAGKGA